METREQLLAAATRRFAARGFYGASIADVADDVGLTKQALIHHFGTKEKLYGEVLQRIADRLDVTLERAMQGAGTPASKLERLLVALLTDTGGEGGRLLMREILDNEARAERAERWYLRPFLGTLTAAMREVPGWQSADEAEVFAATYQLLGAVTYFTISGPTLSAILGKRVSQEVRDAFPAQLSALIRATLARPPRRARGRASRR